MPPAAYIESATSCRHIVGPCSRSVPMPYRAHVAPPTPIHPPPTPLCFAVVRIRVSRCPFDRLKVLLWCSFQVHVLELVLQYGTAWYNIAMWHGVGII